MLLEVDGVSKTFRGAAGAVRAVDDVSFSVDEGECVGIVGGSGSGKSTLAGIVLGLECADEGHVTFQGIEMDARARRARRPRAAQRALLDMQLVFQLPFSSFSASATVFQGVREGFAYRREERSTPRARDRARVEDALERVGLDASYADRKIAGLSGGECQRVALARAVVSHPRLLVCDEPTSALDVTVQAGIVELIARLCQDEGMACLFITHNLALARGLCGRVCVMDRGRIVESGPSARVLTAPESSAAKLLVASLLRV